MLPNHSGLSVCCVDLRDVIRFLLMVCDVFFVGDVNICLVLDLFCIESLV